MENSKTYIGIQPDAARFFVPVEMDRPRVLAFDSRAAFMIHRRFGASFFFELYERDPEKPGMFVLRSHDVFVYFLWAGLQRDARAAGEELTIEHVEDQIVPTEIDALAQSLLVALAATRRAAAPKNA